MINHWQSIYETNDFYYNLRKLSKPGGSGGDFSIIERASGAYLMATLAEVNEPVRFISE